MMKPSPTRRPVPPSEEGYILLFAIFLMALLVLSLAIAAPQVAKSIQRDRDLETFHRGMQYRRAVQLYYRKFHAYPPNVDALVKTDEIRFLRKKYVDPITNKADWKPVLYGQNKTPTAMGFFGQPLAGGATSIAGTGPSGGNGLDSSGGTSSTSTGSGGSLPGGISDIFGGSPTSPTSSPTSTTGGTGTNPSTSGTSGSSGSSSSDQSGQTFGGAGIIGFSPASSRQSILIYKKKNHYNEWEFTYDPISDMQTMSGGNSGSSGLPTGSATTSPSGNVFGSQQPNPNTGTISNSTGDQTQQQQQPQQ